MSVLGAGLGAAVKGDVMELKVTPIVEESAVDVDTVMLFDTVISKSLMHFKHCKSPSPGRELLSFSKDGRDLDSTLYQIAHPILACSFTQTVCRASHGLSHGGARESGQTSIKDKRRNARMHRESGRTKRGRGERETGRGTRNAVNGERSTACVAEHLFSRTQ
jgi:hypothetical protein